MGGFGIVFRYSSMTYRYLNTIEWTIFIDLFSKIKTKH